MELRINGELYEVDIPDGMPLVWTLRDSIGLTGTKFGCGIGICGSCTVHVDGVPTRSCITPAETVLDKDITTIEGLATVDANGQETLHPIQQAFIDEQVPQCSWCMSGQMMTAAAFIENNASPTEDEITAAMSANYCRCGCYARIREAVAVAAENMGESS